MRGVLVRGWTVMAIVAACALALMTAAIAGAGERNRAAGGSGSCANATDSADALSIPQLRDAIACLINKERTSRGKKPLPDDGRLQKAAQRHTDQMVQKNCFGHRCPGEPGLEARIRATGYFRGATAFLYAEDVGCARTADEMVDHWMSSALHRRNILARKFKDLGVGASHGQVPKRCGEGFNTFTAVFGYRRG